MMRKASSLPLAVLAGTSALMVPVLAVKAQDMAGQGLVMGLSQTLQTVTNPGLDDPATGTTTSAITRLSFALDSSASGEGLSAFGDIGLTLSHDGGDDIAIEIGSPHLGLRYQRQGANSALSFDASYGRDAIGTVLSVDDFLDDEGQLVLPEDLDEITGSGMRDSYALGARLELGSQSPLGLILEAGYDKTTYSGTSDPALVDESAFSLGATGRLAFGTRGEVTLGVRQSDQTAQGSPDSQVQSLDFGARYALSPVLTLSGLVSLETTDEEGGATSDETLVNLGLDYRLAPGLVSLDFGPDSVALAWEQRAATSQFLARLSHGPDSTGDGTLNMFSLGYDQAINEVSGLGVIFAYSDTDTPSQDSTGTDLIFSYSRALTPEWGLQAGVNYRVLDETGSDTAESTGLFLTVSREFGLGN